VLAALEFQKAQRCPGCDAVWIQPNGLFDLHNGIDGDYIALAVHQAARVCAAGHGGQVVVSDVTRADVEGALPADASLVSLGEFRLKDFDDPAPLHQLAHRDLPDAFPALRALPAAGHNLPFERNPFIGRRADVSGVAALLASVRIVTLVGPGGVGKTRLALEVARQAIPRFPDGVWLVDLAPLDDPRTVPSAVAGALGVREEPNRPILRTLVEALAGKRTLLVLDNCEHLSDASAELVDAVVGATEGVAVLSTSRAPTRAAGENLWAVSPMPADDATRLFLARAQAARHNVALTEANDDVVASICRQVDGLPLAIELAAARSSVLSPAQILDKLETRLALLAGGRRETPDRHRTLRATIQWSYELLPPGEKALFRRLSVFRGGCTLDAAEAVADADLDLVQSLVETSLLLAVDGRFSMLETIREFAWEALEADESEPEGAEVVHRRHTEHFAAIAPALGRGARSSEPSALAALDADYANILAAFDWALAERRSDLFELFVEGLWYEWVRRGQTADGYRRAEDAVQSSPHPSPRLLTLTAELARFSGALERAVVLKLEALAGFEASGAMAAQAAATHTDLAEALTQLGRLDEAEEHAHRGLAIRTELGDPYGVAHATTAVAFLGLARGNYEEAASVGEAAIDVFRDRLSWSDLAWTCVTTATAHAHLGDARRARELLREALGLAAQIAEAAVTVEAIEQTAVLAAMTGHDETALRLSGASSAGRKLTGFAPDADEAALALSGHRVEPTRRAKLLEEGAQWDLDTASARALEFLTA
jgi:predicted ATPase